MGRGDDDPSSPARPAASTTQQAFSSSSSSSLSSVGATRLRLLGECTFASSINCAQVCVCVCAGSLFINTWCVCVIFCFFFLLIRALHGAVSVGKRTNKIIY